jgi:hypothetical protein
VLIVVIRFVSPFVIVDIPLRVSSRVIMPVSSRAMLLSSTMIDAYNPAWRPNRHLFVLRKPHFRDRIFWIGALSLNSLPSSLVFVAGSDFGLELA